MIEMEIIVFVLIVLLILLVLWHLALQRKWGLFNEQVMWMFYHEAKRVGKQDTVVYTAQDEKEVFKSYRAKLNTMLIELWVSEGMPDRFVLTVYQNERPILKRLLNGKIIYIP